MDISKNSWISFAFSLGLMVIFSFGVWHATRDMPDVDGQRVFGFPFPMYKYGGETADGTYEAVFYASIFLDLFVYAGMFFLIKFGLDKLNR